MLRRWFKEQKWALAVGLGLTLLALVLLLTGVTRRLEWLGFDFHVRHFSDVPASESILHVDIDDDALDRVGSWPWPRDLQGELIRILAELGADQIVMDIVWTEPRSAELRLPELDPLAELEGEVDVVGELTEENLVWPDDELAAAIAATDNVYLAMYFAERDEADSAGGLANAIAALLRADFELGPAELADKLETSRESVAAILAGVKRRVARELVHEILQVRPDATPREVHDAILTTPFERVTADRVEVLTALHRELGLKALRQKCPPVPDRLKDRLPRVDQVVPPIRKIASAGRHLGFVTFAPDADGRTRHVPLLVEWEGRMLEQLAFAAARDKLNITLEDLSIDDDHLVIAARDERPKMRIQLDDQGQMLINWHTAKGQWQHCFEHIPVTRLLQIWDCRRTIRENDVRRDLHIAEALKLAKDPGSFELYRDNYRAMLANQRKVRRAGLLGDSDDEAIREAAAEAARLREWIDKDEQATIAFIKEVWQQLEAEPDPEDAAIAEDYRRFATAHRLVTADVEEIDRINAGIEREEEQLIGQLRPAVNGRTCFVGYTATAVADMVNTPAYERMPGVLVHSNVFNSMVEGQFRTWAGTGAQAATILLFGVLITLITTTRGPRTSLALVLAVLIVTVSLNAWGVFEHMDHWLRLLTALGLTFFVWAMIVLLHYLTTDRQKRHFRKAVAQYVSPAMANQIAESGVELDLAPVRGDVTCVFTDLQGFTQISERLGPDGTRTVLNPYLEAMSTVLHRRRALINKFMGDGVFAFFNPPILPCLEHREAACDAALECQEALRELAGRYADHPLAEGFARLAMRIGIASGPVFVGDYGSENKLDYTCVGDTVNLAARLESANKQFGTRILVAGDGRGDLADRYVFRDLGLIRVKGQTVRARVFELLGRHGEVGSDLRAHAEAFACGLKAFADRDWDQAVGAFERAQSIRPDDGAVQRYQEAIADFRRAAPPQDWDGSLELTEK